MAARSYSEAYLVILSLLRECGLGWVVSQIQEQVRTGKPTLKSVSTQPDVISQRFLDEADNTQVIRGRRQRLAGTEDYSDYERLDIAIAAIESAVLQTTAMEESVLDFFTSHTDGIAKITFEPDEFEETERLIIESPSETRRESTRQLKLAVNKLREEMHHVD